MNQHITIHTLLGSTSEILGECLLSPNFIHGSIEIGTFTLFKRPGSDAGCRAIGGGGGGGGGGRGGGGEEEEEEEEEEEKEEEEEEAEEGFNLRRPEIDIQPDRN
jgi:hypothetical protein